eukprot:sb/3478027/
MVNQETDLELYDLLRACGCTREIRSQINVNLPTTTSNAFIAKKLLDVRKNDVCAREDINKMKMLKFKMEQELKEIDRAMKEKERDLEVLEEFRDRIMRSCPGR